MSLEPITISNMAYSKLHSSLVASSLWRQPDNVRILFITLLAMCDRHGEVYGTRPGIEHIANISWDPDEGDEDPFEILMAPDSDSSDRLRNPENEGRRIEEIPGGFRLLNFAYYRGLRNDDDRREQNRLSQERYRDKQHKPKSAKISRVKPPSADESHDNPAPSVSVSDSESVLKKKKAATEEEVIEYCISIGLPKSDGESLWLKWEENGWRNNGSPIRDWRMTIRRWRLDNILPSQRTHNTTPVSKGTSLLPAPTYPKISESREVSDEEFSKWAETGKAEVAKLKEKFRMPT